MDKEKQRTESIKKYANLNKVIKKQSFLSKQKQFDPMQIIKQKQDSTKKENIPVIKRQEVPDIIDFTLGKT